MSTIPVFPSEDAGKKRRPLRGTLVCVLVGKKDTYSLTDSWDAGTPTPTTTTWMGSPRTGRCGGHIHRPRRGRWNIYADPGEGHWCVSWLERGSHTRTPTPTTWRFVPTTYADPGEDAGTPPPTTWRFAPTRGHFRGPYRFMDPDEDKGHICRSRRGTPTPTTWRYAPTHTF